MLQNSLNQTTLRNSTRNTADARHPDWLKPIWKSGRQPWSGAYLSRSSNTGQQSTAEERTVRWWHLSRTNRGYGGEF